jgi:DNA-binding SARP family transcriptional activator
MEADFKRIQYRLADEYFACGNHEKAVDALEKALFNDPCDEEAITRYIEIKLHDGDCMAAVKAYKKYEAVLWKELCISPALKLRELMIKNKLLD